MRGQGFFLLVLACRRQPSELVVEPEASATLAWHVLGTPEDGLTPAVAAGDVNGDGYADLLAGAPLWHAHDGRALVYLGSPEGVGLEPEEILPDRDVGYFGNWTAGLGDVEGDGFDDVLVGDATGAFFVYSGSTDGVVATPSAVLDAVRAWPAGDVNGDAHADVLALLDYDSDVMSLYLGSSEGLSSPATTLEMGHIYDVAAADLDGDGFDDLVLEAQQRLYVYSGGPTGIGDAPVEVGVPDGGYVFESMAAAGDVDGDGYDDLLTGARCLGCASFLFRGSVTGISEERSEIISIDGGDLGDEVDAAGDVNGDGFADFVVSGDAEDWSGLAAVFQGSSEGIELVRTLSVAGSPGVAHGVGDVDGDDWDDVAMSDGSQYRVYVYAGGPDGLGESPDSTIVAARSDRLGTGADGVGDVDGDGFGDVAVGAWGAGGMTGEVLVYGGSASGLPSMPTATLLGDGPYSWFGAAVAGAGDVDGDGFDDVAIGTYDDRAFVYLGSAEGLSARVELTPPDVDFFCCQVVGLGDVDGDGFPDVAASGWSDQAGSWHAYVYAGGAAGMTGSPVDLGVTTDMPGDTVVARAGDLDGDGLAEVAIGTPHEGVVYVFSGGASSTRLTGQRDGWFGGAVGAVGDVNGDGYADLGVGVDSPSMRDPGGGATVCSGSAAGPEECSSPLLHGEYVRYSVAGAGDVDEDGYDDVIVGGTVYYADDDYSPPDGPMAARVFAGAVAGPSDHGTLLVGPGENATGTSTSPVYGYRLTLGAADVNGDGRTEVLVGSPEDNWSGGAAFLFTF